MPSSLVIEIYYETFFAENSQVERIALLELRATQVLKHLLVFFDTLIKLCIFRV